MSAPRRKPETVVTRAARNFRTLLEAAANGDLALLEVRERATGERRAAIVAANRLEDGSVEFAPFALMLEGNPFELLDPPAPGGGFADPEQEETP